MADQIAINVKVIDDEVGPKLRALRDNIKSTFAEMQRSAAVGGSGNASFKRQLDEARGSLLGLVASA